MNDGKFQWDDRKAAANDIKHGVSFDIARAIFLDAFAVDQIDDREDYGEERFTITGTAKGRVLFVVYAMRGECIRIVSARAAEPREERDYHDHLTGNRT